MSVALRADGHVVYEATVPPFDAVAVRANVLGTVVDQAIADGATKVNLRFYRNMAFELSEMGLGAASTLSSSTMIQRDSAPEPVTLRVPNARPSEARTLRIASWDADEVTIAQRLGRAIDDEETTADRYRTLEPIARGGMGEIVRALDTQIGREVAIKRLPPLNGARAEEWKRRFLREARVQALLEHPSIVPVYDVGYGPGGQPFFSMKRVVGETLHEILERSSTDDLRRSRNRLLRAFVAVCHALYYAHESGVVHRDLKPDNVMVGPHGEVYVLDWGVARILEITRTGATAAIPLPEDETLPGETVGTPGYMSPEQALGILEDIDGRSDVFSMGTILFELLTGEHFFVGIHAQGLMQKTIDPNRAPKPPRADVPPELHEVIERATAFDKSARYQSAQELAQDIERYLDGDRDEEHRARLVKEAVLSATRLADRALDGPVEEREQARSQAMRDAGRALALAPENQAAQAVILRLLAAPPERVPAEAQREIDEVLERQQKAALRGNAARVAGWAALFPLILMMTHRVPQVIALIGAFNLVLTMMALFMARRGRASGTLLFTFAALVTLFAGVLTALLGPLVFVPGFAGANAVVLATLAEKRHRIPIYLLACASFLVPLALELTGVVPPSMRFEGGAMTLVPRAVELTEGIVIITVAITSIVGVVMPARVANRFRDAMLAAETKLCVQKWQLAQLAPPKARPAGSG